MSQRRWLHLRHPEGFDAERFRRFEAGCRVWEAYVRAVVAEGLHQMGAVDYRVGTPTLSDDRTVASLPLDGFWTLGSRAHFENAASHLLREFMPFPFAFGLEEGLEEDIGDGAGHRTHWRPALRPLSASKGEEG